MPWQSLWVRTLCLVRPEELCRTKVCATSVTTVSDFLALLFPGKTVNTYVVYFPSVMFNCSSVAFTVPLILPFENKSDVFAGAVRFAVSGSREVILARTRELHDNAACATLNMAKARLLTLDEDALQKVPSICTCVIGKAKEDCEASSKKPKICAWDLFMANLVTCSN